MADWKGRGKGRKAAQPRVDIRGGEGKGGGRAGAQPVISAPDMGWARGGTVSISANHWSFE